jgi:hypothetical protein
MNTFKQKTNLTTVLCQAWRREKYSNCSFCSIVEQQQLRLQKWASLFWVCFVVWALDFLQVMSADVLECRRMSEKGDCSSCY